MTDPTPTDPAEQLPQEQKAPESPPPWGDDFDPARAWHTIQSLREREKELSKQPRLTARQREQLDEYDRLIEASKSEAERQQEALDTARRDAETWRHDAVRYKAAAAHGIPADHFDLLGTGTEEEITARAEKLAQLLAAKAAPTPPKPPTRPVEQMRPGATPGEAETEDDAVYARLFGSASR